MNEWADPESYGREAAKVVSRGEAMMLAVLWPERKGWSIKCQFELEGYFIDLAIPEAHLAVEVDSFAAHGSSKAMEHDAVRSNRMLAVGWATVRYPSQRVLMSAWQCASDVLGHIGRRVKVPHRAPVPRAEPLPPAPYDPVAVARGANELLSALTSIKPEDGVILRRRA